MSRSPESGVSYLTYIPNVLWPSDLKHVPPDPDLLEKVSELMTPSEILEISDFDKPETISPDRYKTFGSATQVMLATRFRATVSRKQTQY